LSKIFRYSVFRDKSLRYTKKVRHYRRTSTMAESTPAKRKQSERDSLEAAKENPQDKIRRINQTFNLADNENFSEIPFVELDRNADLDSDSELAILSPTEMSVESLWLNLEYAAASLAEYVSERDLPQITYMQKVITWVKLRVRKPTPFPDHPPPPTADDNTGSPNFSGNTTGSPTRLVTPTADSGTAAATSNALTAATTVIIGTTATSASTGSTVAPPTDVKLPTGNTFTADGKHYKQSYKLYIRELIERKIANQTDIEQQCDTQEQYNRFREMREAFVTWIRKSIQLDPTPENNPQLKQLGKPTEFFAKSAITEDDKWLLAKAYRAARRHANRFPVEDSIPASNNDPRQERGKYPRRPQPPTNRPKTVASLLSNHIDQQPLLHPLRQPYAPPTVPLRQPLAPSSEWMQPKPGTTWRTNYQSSRLPAPPQTIPINNRFQPLQQGQSYDYNYPPLPSNNYTAPKNAVEDRLQRLESIMVRMAQKLNHLQ